MYKKNKSDFCNPILEFRFLKYVFEIQTLKFRI